MFPSPAAVPPTYVKISSNPESSYQLAVVRRSGRFAPCSPRPRPVPPSRDIRRLLEIMAALRAPGSGCPWNLEQTRPDGKPASAVLVGAGLAEQAPALQV